MKCGREQGHRQGQQPSSSPVRADSGARECPSGAILGEMPPWKAKSPRAAAASTHWPCISHTHRARGGEGSKQTLSAAPVPSMLIFNVTGGLIFFFFSFILIQKLDPQSWGCRSLAVPPCALPALVLMWEGRNSLSCSPQHVLIPSSNPVFICRSFFPTSPAHFTISSPSPHHQFIPRMAAAA